MNFSNNILGYKTQFFRVALLMVLLVSTAFSKAEAPDINAKVKAIFLYNFSKYIEWPSNMASGNFKVAVYGNYPALVAELQQMARQKTRGAQKFEIVVYNSLNDLKPSHMLYVTDSRSEELTHIIKKVNDTNTLVVSDNRGAINKGSGINFFYENNKQKFEISPTNLTGHGLKVSDQLTILAKVVN